MRSTLTSEAQNVTKQPYGTYANPRSVYANTGGNTLLETLQSLEARVNQQQTDLNKQQTEFKSEFNKQQTEFKSEFNKQQTELARLAAEVNVLGGCRASAAAARKRFYIQSKLRLSGGPATPRDRNVIIEGNTAVHGGDLRTDAALFELGDLGSVHKMEFERLYGMTTLEASTIKSARIVTMANKKASGLAEGRAWAAADNMAYDEVLQFWRTGSEADLSLFENDVVGRTAAARRWYTFMSSTPANN